MERTRLIFLSLESEHTKYNFQTVFTGDTLQNAHHNTAPDVFHPIYITIHVTQFSIFHRDLGPDTLLFSSLLPTWVQLWLLSTQMSFF